MVPDTYQAAQAVVQGGELSAATTTSIKTANRANRAAVHGFLAGQRFAIAAAADEAVNGVHASVVADEKGVRFACVAALILGAVVIRYVKGTEATFATSHAVTIAAAPNVTTAQIQAVIGDVPYVILGEYCISRTGDTTIVESAEFGTREGFGAGL